VSDFVCTVNPIDLLSQWISEGYPSKITDSADEAVMGGSIKIDSVQNVITLRRDLHYAWDNYELGVDPNVSPIIYRHPQGSTL
jgi:hypothetical protein